MKFICGVQKSETIILQVVSAVAEMLSVQGTIKVGERKFSLFMPAYNTVRKFFNNMTLIIFVQNNLKYNLVCAVAECICLNANVCIQIVLLHFSQK